MYDGHGYGAIQQILQVTSDGVNRLVVRAMVYRTQLCDRGTWLDTLDVTTGTETFVLAESIGRICSPVPHPAEGSHVLLCCPKKNFSSSALKIIFLTGL